MIVNCKDINSIVFKTGTWSSDEDKILVSEFSSGRTMLDISRELNRSPRSVEHRIRTLRDCGVQIKYRYGKYKERQYWSDDQKKQLIELYNMGHCRKDIAMYLGKSVNSVISKLEYLRGLGLLKLRGCGVARNIVEDRLLNRIEINVKTGCWEYEGFKINGYGTIYANGKRIPTHRWSYSHWKNNDKPLPSNLMVRHLCHNPCCCNPKHLEIGTAKDNVKDMIEAGRAYWQQ